MTGTLQMDRLLVAIGVVTGAMITGFILRMLLGRLRNRAEDSAWAWDDLVVAMLRTLAVPALTAAGNWASVLVLELRADLRSIVGRVLSVP